MKEQKMNLIKVSEATPMQLDWLVAKLVGPLVNAYGDEVPERRQFSRDWAHGGPIIDHEMQENGFDLWAGVHTKDECAATYSRGVPDSYVFGPTPLIAAMRCYVISRLGETVEIPEELK